MKQSRFVAVPPAHVASSRLARRVTRAIVAREQGWSLENLTVSRRWRFQIAGSRWSALAYASFHFTGSGRVLRGNASYAIYFTGKGSASALKTSALVRDLQTCLTSYRQTGAEGKDLLFVLSDDTRPKRLLAELDGIAAAFGSADRHRVPPSRSRALGPRLAAVADVVLARGTWELETQSVRIRRGPAAVNISSGPKMSTMLFVPKASSFELLARAKARGYVGHAREVVASLALHKLQPLSLRAALAEARFLETELPA